jgi:isoquinoline 1-oxidoreductase subunit beta
MGFIDNPFHIANLRCENGKAEAHPRLGWFRSMSNIPHNIANSQICRATCRVAALR